MKKIICLILFVIMSVPVLAEDITQTELYKCMKREGEAIRRVIFKECGVSESLLNDEKILEKLTDTQKQCVKIAGEKNQEKYKAEINKIMEKCSNVK